MGANGAGLAPQEELSIEIEELPEDYPIMGADGAGLAPQEELSVEIEELAQLEEEMPLSELAQASWSIYPRDYYDDRE